MTAKEFLQERYPDLRDNNWNNNPYIGNNWVARMMEEYVDHITSINKQSEKPEWKKGDWLIREWNENTLDFSLYHSLISNNTFTYIKFYRFINEKIDESLSSFKYKTSLINSEKNIKWRLATEEEITKYARIIIEG